MRGDEQETLAIDPVKVNHTSGRYNRHAIGKLEAHVLTDKLTAAWQLSDLPN